MYCFKSNYLLALLSVILITGCAKRGNVSGGAKDTIPPVLRMSFPKNYSTGFTGKQIRLVFDEYVKLKDVNKQLIVSPPMKRAPDISPLVASRTINIRIYDTLQPNTTYSFNFGQSIEDNNEGNLYPQFKYVFSTGSYIDSLRLSGSVKDAFEKQTDSYVSVMLYEADETYTDSIIYKESPRYITNTLDSATTFTFENLKAGKYRLVAMKDVNSNYKFDPKTDKIGFQRDFITIPNDTLYELELFREEIPFKAIKPSQASGNRLIAGYEGNPKDIKAIVRNGADVVPSIVTQFPQKDSVNIWYRSPKVDSLMVNITKGNYTNDFSTRIKNQKKDTLSFSAVQSGTLPLRENFTITPSRPLVKFDNSKITLVNKDSVAVPFTTEYDEFNMKLKFLFTREPLEKYTLTALPGALTDYLDEVNDTLKYTVTTKNVSDYGNLRVTLDHVRRFPIIVEITNAKGEVVASQYSENASVIDFNALEPALYTLRVIYDENANKVWDTGSFLQKRQSEEVNYFAKEIDVRANWDVEQPFILP
ncbi:MAG TPA: Ig-like domain-containing protein [Flavobacterium sp.]|jgi:uncharacterized protein (DUF2141 family)